MRTQNIDLQLHRLFLGDDLAHVVAESGRKAVDLAIFRKEPFRELPRPRHLLHILFRKAYRRAEACDGDKFLDRHRRRAQADLPDPLCLRNFRDIQRNLHPNCLPFLLLWI
ncbi:hypothetical protein SDC9_178708 [bioreactor metagenome]|uniref:Uncharacterized protein n=1 Tax=bioreactor metagenome TaxID=1076179 RepID=A0A645H4F9_9ZZZZ